MGVRRVRGKLAPPGFEQLVDGNNSPAQILMAKLSECCYEARGFLSLFFGFLHRFGKRENKTIEEVRIDFAHHVSEDDHIPYDAGGLVSPRRIDSRLQNLVARTQKSAEKFQNAGVMETLEHFVSGE